MSGRFRMRQCTFGQTIHTVSNGFLFFDVFGSPDEAQRVCDRLNELAEENKELKKENKLLKDTLSSIVFDGKNVEIMTKGDVE